MAIFIYALVSTGGDSDILNLAVKGLKDGAGRELTTIISNQISAVVGDLDNAGLIADRVNALAFAGIIDALADQFTLLPMRFGSKMESSEAILLMLEKNHNEILQNLQQVQNKCEFGLKIFCDPDKINAKISSKTEIERPTGYDPVLEPGASVFREYVNKKLHQHRLEELRLTFITSLISEITECLSELNPISQFKKMVTSTTIIDSVFLLDKSREKGLVDAVEELQSRYPELHFILTGPWPPYSFVDIKLK